jgi:hypothetical protein
MKVWSDARTKKERKALYLSLLPTIRKVARKSGYAIGVHGSLTRDFDLIAAKWSKNAVNPETLAFRIHAATSKYSYTRKALRTFPQNKPHGRIGYPLILGHEGAYIDLSIMA